MIIKLRQKKTPKYPSALLISYAKTIWAILIISLFVCYFLVDKPLTLYFSQRPPIWKQTGSALSGFFDPLFVVCAIPLLFFVSKHLRWSLAISSLLKLLIFALPLSLAIVHVLKSGLARYRPKKLFTQELYGFYLHSPFSHDCSFPSGHACIIGALVGALGCSFPKYTWHLLALGIVLSMSRVLALDHYLSDILAGVTIGAMTSQALFIFMKNHEIKI